ncbi:MAG: alpha/beta hydrolase [Burkholderiales bacterium]|nr:alpha/beta hydrolase [Burkholderiales bacterium]
MPPLKWVVLTLAMISRASYRHGNHPDAKRANRGLPSAPTRQCPPDQLAGPENTGGHCWITAGSRSCSADEGTQRAAAAPPEIDVPVTDASFETHSYKKHADGCRRTKSTVKWFGGAYLSGESRFRNRLAAPPQATLAQLADLPPALIVTAENDELRDEGEPYAAPRASGSLSLRRARARHPPRSRDAERERACRFIRRAQRDRVDHRNAAPRLGALAPHLASSSIFRP